MLLSMDCSLPNAAPIRNRSRLGHRAGGPGSCGTTALGVVPLANKKAGRLGCPVTIILAIFDSPVPLSGTPENRPPFQFRCENTLVAFLNTPRNLPIPNYQITQLFNLTSTDLKRACSSS